MSRNNHNNLGIRDSHLSEEVLLMLVDGELESREAVSAKEHLESCWSCRSSLENIEETISAFVDFRRSLQKPLQQSPPSGWGDFKARLRACGPHQSPRAGRWTNFGAFRSLRLRWAATLVIGLCSLAILWTSLNQNEVSAMELMERAVAFEEKRLLETRNPVVFKRLAIRLGDTRTVELGIWNEASSANSRREILPDATDADRELLREITELMEGSEIGIEQLMSPKSVLNWHSSNPKVVSKVVVDEFYTLETRAIGVIPEGGVTTLVVRYRRSDFHPVMQVLKIRSSTGVRTIEINERTFDVVERRSLPEDFFNQPEFAVTSSDKVTDVAEAPKQDVELPIPAIPTATADLEVYVLTLLSSIGADLGEEISVSRSAGVLIIRGVVDNQSRLAEVEAALEPLSRNQAVRFELETIAQAVTRQRNPSATPNAEIKEIETTSVVSPAERDLTEFFGNESEARRFAQISVSRSSSAMNHIYALRSLSSRFETTELQSMTADARSGWVALIKRHAMSFKAQNGLLASELSSVLRVQRESKPVVASPTDVSALLETVNRLISVATTNDQLIRSAMTISNEESRFSAIKARAFWQSIEAADALASAVAEFR